MILFKDISYAQGAYNMDANPDPMVMMKMSGGDNGLYYDSQASRNYNNAIRTGKVPFMYHFYGGADPTTEADWFVKACSPLAPGDGLAVDIEQGQTWNPQADAGAVGKVLAFVSHVHDVTGVWPWVYMNMSTANMYDWSPVFNNCGFWCAAPSYGFNDTLPVKYPQLAQQGPIEGGVDTDAAFATIEEVRKYTYAPTPPPAPVQPPAPAPLPPPVQPPSQPTPPVVVPSPPVVVPTQPPEVTPSPTPPATPTVVTSPVVAPQTHTKTLAAVIAAIVAFIIALLAGLHR